MTISAISASIINSTDVTHIVKINIKQKWSYVGNIEGLTLYINNRVEIDET